MAISEEVRQLISILEEEDFGALAGELLTEMSLGRAVEKTLQLDDTDEADEQDTVVVRVPYEEGEQLREAMAFLRLRLVQPMRAFAEAEQIAAKLADRKGMRIRFIDPVEHVEAEPLSRRAMGDASLVDQLDAFLERLPAMIEPPRGART